MFDPVAVQKFIETPGRQRHIQRGPLLPGEFLGRDEIEEIHRPRVEPDIQIPVQHAPENILHMEDEARVHGDGLGRGDIIIVDARAQIFQGCKFFRQRGELGIDRGRGIGRAENSHFFGHGLPGCLGLFALARQFLGIGSPPGHKTGGQTAFFLEFMDQGAAGRGKVHHVYRHVHGAHGLVFFQSISGGQSDQRGHGQNKQDKKLGADTDVFQHDFPTRKK